MKIEIVGDWEEDLCWCPSHLYLNLKYGNQHFVIYLRWRHTDPWTANLIVKGEDYKINGGGCHSLDIEYYSDREYKELQSVVVDISKKYIYSGQHLLNPRT